MGQQPNVELDPADRPRAVPEPPPARRWDPRHKAGVIVSPDQVPYGGSFGTPGPDTGWALRLINLADIPGRTPELEAVLAALMSARSGRLGRAPVIEDLRAAEVLCGIGGGLPAWTRDRCRRWKAATAHETSKGRAAVAEVDPDLLIEPPDRIRWVLAHGRQQDGDPEPHAT